MGEEEAPKYQLEDILNKKKAQPQVLDLHGFRYWILDLRIASSIGPPWIQVLDP